MRIVAPKSLLYQWEPGRCVVAHDANYIFVPIPKCSSRYTLQILNIMCAWNEDSNYHKTNFDDKTKIVVLRDPLERWKSGVLHHFFMKNHNMTDNLLDYVFNQLTLESHSELQVRFLQNIDTDSCIFFNLDEEYSENLKHFIIHTLNKNYTFWNKTNELYSRDNKKHEIIWKNSTADRPKKIQDKQTLSDYIERNPDCMIRLKEYLKPDYDLIANIKFYNRENENSST